MIRPADEFFHAVGDDPSWQESLYFNWSDPASGMFGVARMGFRFASQRGDGLIFVLQHGQPVFAYAAVNKKLPQNWNNLAESGSVQIGNMRFCMNEAFQQWELSLDNGSDSMRLQWDAFHAPYDYGASNQKGPPQIAAAHFEHSGTVRGYTDFHGTRTAITGTGQRDKSWGVRDWANIQGWEWISAQFGTQMSFNAWTAPYKGQTYLGGYMYGDFGVRELMAINIEYAWQDGLRNVPKSAFLQLSDIAGQQYEVRAEGQGCFPLFFKGLWMEEVQARFTLNFDGQNLDGVGVIEHAWHANVLDVLRRGPLIAKTLRQALLR